MTNQVIQFWKTGENPITCYTSKPCKNLERVPLGRKSQTQYKQPVLVTDEKGVETPFGSIIEAAHFIGVDKNVLYSIVNGYRINDTNYTITKK